MANALYPLAKQRLLEWAFNDSGPAGAADLCVIGVDDTYNYSITHEDLTDISGTAIVAPEQVIDNAVFTLGVTDGDDVNLASMEVGETLDAFVVYFKWASATLLLCYMDTPTNATIPQLISSPTGLLVFDDSGIFSL